MKQSNFLPNWASPPGETIINLMGIKKISIIDLSRILNLTINETTSLLSGIKNLSIEIAKDLENFLGGSAGFWLSREQQFRADIERIPLNMRYDSEWLDEVPFKELVKLGWVQNHRSKNERAREMLDFFGIELSTQWSLRYPPSLIGGAFRTSSAFDAQHESVSSWLRQGEKQGDRIKCAKWNPELFYAQLKEIRGLTRNRYPTKFIPMLRKLCAECGVALAIARTPKGCYASGASCFLSQDKAMLLLSFRFKSDDQFWFTFFHEAAHLLLHNIEDIFIDEGSHGSEEDALEREANEFAADYLIPKRNREDLFNLPLKSRTVIRFALQIGISPGIVVGQLQKLGLLDFNQLNSLKRRYKNIDIEKAANL